MATNWVPELQIAANIAEDHPTDPAQGFMQMSLVNGWVVRGRIRAVFDDHQVVYVGDRPGLDADQLIEVGLDQVVTFEYTDPTTSEGDKLVTPPVVRGRPAGYQYREGEKQ